LADPNSTRLPEGPGQRVRWGRMYGAALPYVLAQIARRDAQPMLVLAEDQRAAERIVGALRFFLGDALPVHLFPDWETLPYDRFSPHQDILSDRLEVLYELPHMRHGILVSAANTASMRLPPRDFVQDRSLILKLGDALDLDQIRTRMSAAGYISVPQVAEHGEYAVRGALFDLFPMGQQRPLRVDLLDREIESIRRFDPANQRSLEQVDSLRILPGREHPADDAAIASFRQRWRQRFEGDPAQSRVYSQVSQGIFPGGIEYYLPLFFDSTSTLFDALPAQTLIIAAGDLPASLAAFQEQLAQRHADLGHDPERPILDPEEIALSDDEVEAAIARFARVDARSAALPPGTDGDDLPFAAPPPLRLTRDQEAGATETFLTDTSRRTLLVAESPGRRETLMELLAGRDLHPRPVTGWDEFISSGARLALTVAPLEDGLNAVAEGINLVTEAQLLGERTRQRRRRRPDLDPAAIIRDLADLQLGAPVVHEGYGVGRYLGLTTLSVDDFDQEFLALEYASGDRLYVPVASLHLISRYAGASPDKAPLHRLGGEAWTRARQRAAARVRDVAAELLDLYARRAARLGRACRIDPADLLAFSEEFPFELTPDQAQTIDAVLRDLSAVGPMDRLVCGDVGFGKTEVALRAAFVTAGSGAQVTIIVPTTLLAQQHYQTFSDRLAGWPFRVELLSRFRKGKAAAATLDGLADGSVDVVIGTHALLQPAVRFKDLGLVIIDEEHRFGVRHKERLKALRSEVDVLTLTATPIPRTLNMAMGGLRDLSLITTPPEDRLAVKTFVSEWEDGLIREACLREIRRGGQIYFVHNRVQTIERVHEQLTRLLPEIVIRVAHGQMRERDLEQVMLDFYHRRIDLLLCTTIIESGIDVPTANTIIIDRADRFGLAQLHQLRGRVGRSHHRAYAYLLAPDKRALTPDAVKRLEAIESTEELGAGFTLASHDLEIRGAGELLGDEQSGQIQEVGFTLYQELLERAVAALRDGREPELAAPMSSGPEVDLKLPALIPADYVPDVHTRLLLYKRMNHADDADELRERQEELIDRFGPLPAQVIALMQVMRVKMAARGLGVERVDAHRQGVRLSFSAQTRVDPMSLIRRAQEDPDRFRLEGETVFRVRMDLSDPAQRVQAVDDLLAELADEAAQPTR
jgi:transcription-repair coupling factor (superfamily II helicase)